MKRIFKQVLGCCGFGLLSCLANQAEASGYKMEFQSAAVLGDAGDAAVVEDASTNWYNSAGLVDLPQQIVSSLIDVYAPVKFRGSALAPSAIPAPFGSDFFATGHATSHPNSAIPSLHYSYPFKNCWALGLSVVPSWGFREDYGNDSIVRYDLKRVYTKTIDVAPSIAMRLNEHWSFGIGPNFDYLSVISNSHVRTQGIAPPLIGSPGDSTTRFSADNWAYGAHGGVLLRFNETTRAGLNYRTKIVDRLDGKSSFALSGGDTFTSRDFELRIPLPPTTTFSLYHDITPCWAVMGSLAYDQWRVLRRYIAKNLVTPVSLIPQINLPQDMSNTIDIGVGTHYTLSDRWMLRGSVKYEPTPTKDRFRDINFPDGEKLGLQIGSRYYVTKRLALDVLYGHVFVKRVAINGINALTLATAKGKSKSTIDLLGGQIVFDI